MTAPLRVLLWSPLRGLDPPSGDISYTEALLADPPAGVRYTTYRQAIEDGTVRVRGRKPWHARPEAVDLAVFAARSAEKAARRSRLMFREHIGYVTIEPGAFDLVHQHLAALRQVGSRVPVVSSAGYPLPELYAWRERWGRWHLRAALRSETWLDDLAGVHNPWLRSTAGDVMTVYSAHFRNWLIARGSDPHRIVVAGTAVPDLGLPPRRSDGRTLGVIARDFYRKGGDIAVEAFRQLHQRDAAWKLVVVTTASSAAEHSTLLRHPGVEVLVDVEREQVLASVLPRVDLLLLPSRSDCGAPYGVIEALQSGAAVVTSDCPWLDERLTLPAVARVPAQAAAVAAAVEAMDADGLAAAGRAARELWHRAFSMSPLQGVLRQAYDGALAHHHVTVRARPQQRLRVLVAGRPFDLSAATYDGFVARHRRMVQTLAATYQVSVLGVTHPSDPPGSPCLPPGCAYVEVGRSPRRTDRWGRLAGAVRAVRNAEDAEDRRLLDAAGALAPDVVVTLGPWLDVDYRPLWRRYPSVHLLEEDLRRMPEIAPQSRQAALLRQLEDQCGAQAAGQPDTVVTISPIERRRAEVRFPRSAHAYLPFTLDPAEWPSRHPTPGGEWVLVVGNFAEPRNAEGLAAVLDATATRADAAGLRFDIVSGPGLTPELAAAVDGVAVRHRRVEGPLAGAYEGAWAALVPARRLTGQKTTILQAWACGVPVVCSAEAAATVGAGPDCVASGNSAEELVDHLVSLRSDPERRAGLVGAGAAILARGFDPRAGQESLCRLVEAAWLRRRSARKA